MKRSLLFLLSAVALGAVLGFMISDIARLAPQLPAPVAPAGTHSGKEPAGTAASAQRPPVSPSTVFGRIIDAISVAVDRSHDSKKVNSVALLLREPVVVVRAGERTGFSLPIGTAVDLVKSEGRFLSVRHEQTVVTIPRSAVMSGTMRTN